MTKTEILKTLKLEMFGYYRSAEYFWQRGNAEEERLKAISNAQCVFQTGAVVLGHNWLDRLKDARSEAREEAANEYLSWQ